MKFLLFLFVTGFALAVCAEEKPKKTMIFQPGAKTPDGHANAAPVVAPAAAAPSAPTAAPVGPAVDVTAADAPAQLAARFFGLLQKGDVENAYDGLTRGSKIAERSEESKALRAKTKEAIDVFGSVLGFELVEVKKVGERMVRQTYLSLGKEFPLRWRFYFYRPDQNWRLVDLRVDDRLVGIFEELNEPRSAETKP